MRLENEHSPFDTFWIETLRELTDQMDITADQAEAASEAYPDLVRAFGLMLSLAGHLRTQTPDLAFTPEIDGFIEKLCTRSPVICGCVQGNTQYCKIIGGHEEVPSLGETCDELFKKYQEALQREREAMIEVLTDSETPLVVWKSSELDRLTTATQESDLIRNQMWKQGCVFPLSG